MAELGKASASIPREAPSRQSRRKGHQALQRARGGGAGGEWGPLPRFLATLKRPPLRIFGGGGGGGGGGGAVEVYGQVGVVDLHGVDLQVVEQHVIAGGLLAGLGEEPRI